jgi:hypothetical protein
MDNKKMDGISLPGIELNYPKTWPGAFMAFALCCTVSFVAYLFFVKADPDVQKAIVNMGPAQPEGQYEEALKLEELVKQKNAVISQLTDDLKSIQKTANDPKLKSEDLANIQPSITNSIKAAEKGMQATTSEISDEDIIKSLAKSDLHVEIIRYFVNKKHWFTGNLYWVTFQLLIDDNRNSAIGKYSRDEISIAINQLIDVRVLYIQSYSAPPKYGLNNGPLLTSFMQYAAI